MSESKSPGGAVGGAAWEALTCGALAGAGAVVSGEGVVVVAAAAGAVVAATAAAGAGVGWLGVTAGSDCTG